MRRDALELLAASATALFVELALIRYLPTEVRVLAYFPNLVLLSAFLGLGVGALLGARRALMPLWAPALLCLVLITRAASGVAFTHDTPGEHFWLLYWDLGEGVTVIEGLRAPLVGFFLLSAAVFTPLGQAVAVRLESMRAAGKPLIGYSWDLGGSLVGVVGFALASWLGAPPVVWFAAVLLTAGPLLRGRLAIAAWLASGLALCGLVATDGAGAIWSPYYELRVEGSKQWRAVLANGALHQIAMEMREDVELTSSDRKLNRNARRGYHAPYKQLGRPIKKALVLGAGTGNDVAVLLDEGAQEVHAVEIDPGILAIGREQHPSRPYDDPRVTVFNTDGRAHLNHTDERYDLIVFGTLDSMTRLSALSNVRLDNFIYTRESLAAARDRLTDDGVLLIFFMVGDEYISQHIINMLTSVFGEPPIVSGTYFHLFNYRFVSGPGAAHLRGAAPPRVRLEGAVVPTDDWPYLYLERPMVSDFYLSLIGLLLLASVAVVLAVSPAMRESVMRGAVDVEMLLFGAAFLLLETKLVTSMSLVWGATWNTSAVVFGSILLVVLAGTLLSHVRAPPRPVIWGGLAVTLVVTGLVPAGTLLGHGFAVRLVASILLVGAPIFFASLWFAASYRTRDHVDVAFGWNLIGAVAGGLLELSSMLFGLAAMHVIAGMLYLLLFWLQVRGRVLGGQSTP